jgi:hypothetical protein
VVLAVVLLGSPLGFLVAPAVLGWLSLRSFTDESFNLTFSAV